MLNSPEPADFWAVSIDGPESGLLDSPLLFGVGLYAPNITNPVNQPKRGSTVNKNDLISAVADTADLSKADAGKAVDSVLDQITGALKKGTDVRLVGFGTFSVAQRKATTGRNPQTGATIQIPASKQPKFKAGKALKDAVN